MIPEVFDKIKFNGKNTCRDGYLQQGLCHGNFDAVEETI